MNEQLSSSAGDAETVKPRWKPLSRIDRRVAGVLVEKAKTTPEQYPMTINGLINGCNQKNNRDPQMQLTEQDLIESLDRLKMAGAAVEVQGSGRVPKFRHLLYEWMGVDKVEIAVMGELLLRGAQTEGELRGRAARMEPIPDLTTLRGILDTLRARGLVIDLTPAGRGQILSHALYEPEELERLRAKVGSAVEMDEPHSEQAARARSYAAPAVAARPVAAPVADASGRLSDELRMVRAEVAELRRDLEALSETVRRQDEEVTKLRSSLGE